MGMNPASERAPDPAAVLTQVLASSNAATPWPAPSIAELAPAFPELAIHECIGQGGMAAVYHATQVRLGRAVALKVMRPELARQPQFVERFLREAKVLATLSSPHVLAIHDFGERGGFCYLVTEFVDGANLRELMQLGRLSPEEVLRIVPQICAGLHFAHQHGVVHRDIKPENVLVDRQGQVKLADFGLAKLVGSAGEAQLTRSSVVMGTPHYMAPEQWHGSAGVDHRADIYSLGVVLYELLTGKLPVGTYAPASAQPGVPAGVDRVVQRSLQQEPELRYQSADDVQRDLERQRAASPAPAAAPLAADAASVARRTSVARQLMAACAVLVFGLLALGLFAAHENQQFLLRMRQSVQARSTDALAAQVSEVVAKGEPWRGVVPEAYTSADRFELRYALGWWIGLVWVLGVAVVAMVLAGGAWRGARQVTGSRVEQLLAGTVFALPPYAAASLAISWFGDQTRQDVWRVVAAVAIAAGAIWLVRRIWQATALRHPAVVPHASAWARRVVACAASVGIALSVLALLAPRHGPTLASNRPPIEAQHVVGMSREQVLEHLGPPTAIVASGTSMRWSYRRLDGSVGDDVVQFTGDAVTAVTNPWLLLVPSLRPASGAWLGQHCDDLVRALGPAHAATSDNIGQTMRFGDGTRAVLSRSGVVLELTK